MCLAEALLRVPDNETADDLIRDKLMSGNWSSHFGQSDSLFVNASFCPEGHFFTPTLIELDSLNLLEQ